MIRMHFSPFYKNFLSLNDEPSYTRRTLLITLPPPHYGVAFVPKQCAVARYPRAAGSFLLAPQLATRFNTNHICLKTAFAQKRLRTASRKNAGLAQCSVPAGSSLASPRSLPKKAQKRQFGGFALKQTTKEEKNVASYVVYMVVVVLDQASLQLQRYVDVSHLIMYLCCRICCRMFDYIPGTAVFPRVR